MRRWMAAVLAAGAAAAGAPAAQAACAFNSAPTLQRCAQQGDVEAVLELADAYNNGSSEYGVAKNLAEALKLYRRAVDLGSGRAALMLGNHYRTGPLETRNTVEALKWYRMGADLGDGTAALFAGDILEEGDAAAGVARDVAQARALYARASNLREGRATERLAQLYAAEGKHAEAIAWWRRAAEANSRYAMEVLGFIYARGEVTPRNGPEAVRWFERARASSSEDATLGLAQMYLYGLGVPKDVNRGLGLLRSRPLGASGTILEHALGRFHDPLDGAQPNAAVAVEAYQAAAAKGSAPARYRLAKLMRAGAGMAKDEAKAAEFLAAASSRYPLAAADLAVQLAERNAPSNAFDLANAAAEEQGKLRARTHADLIDDTPEFRRQVARLLVVWGEKAKAGAADAGLALALAHHQGRLTDKNPQEALRLTRQFAERGEPAALYLLGAMHYFGEAAPKDLAAARRAWQAAAEKGHAVAARELAITYANPKIAPVVDEAAASRWLRLAAELGDVQSAVLLAVRLEDGIGVPADRAEAYAWYESAALRSKGAEQAEVRRLQAELAARHGLSEAQRTAAKARAAGLVKTAH